ncbi:UNVERIFIED_CONTAM: hypothetical protein Slati_4049500 [Sesamum latifolium]|uniref:Uncharacterized protein n=1 Tax=Sesamum latifolium TaxID=2727402 RepID=A0AAW2TVA8_9LAMI
MASKLLLVVVLILDLIAFSLAVAAEQRRSSPLGAYAVGEPSDPVVQGFGQLSCSSLAGLLVASSVRNAYHTKYRTYLSQHPPSCETLRKGVFGAAAAFIVFTGILSEMFYVSYSKTGDGFLPQSQDAGIRMGSI